MQITHRPSSYTETFEKLCPLYMAMGMSYELYWDGDPEAATMYRKAYRLKQNMANEMAWIQGAYIYDALCAVSPIIRAFSKAKKPEPYHQHPYGWKDSTTPPNEKTIENSNDEKAKTVMEVFAASFNSRFTKSSEGRENNG